VVPYELIRIPAENYLRGAREGVVSEHRNDICAKPFRTEERLEDHRIREARSDLLDIRSILGEESLRSGDATVCCGPMQAVLCQKGRDCIMIRHNKDVRIPEFIPIPGTVDHCVVA
jgi:hypothetical protein